MTLKTRRFLFLTLSVSFLIVGATLILYSAGVRVEWKTLSFVRTGGIYIESDPTDVQVKLNGSIVKKGTGLLQTGVFINNLSPDRYRIIVSKNGYLDWQKETDVLPQTVSVFNKIVLVPLKAPERIGESTPDFYVKNNHLVLNNDGGLSYNDKKILGTEVVKLQNSGSVITRSVKTGNYYFSSLSDLNSSLNLSLTFNNLKESKLELPGVVNISKIEPLEYNDRKFIVKTESTLYSLDIERLTLEQIATGVKDFALAKSDLFWIDNKNYLFRYNLPLRNREDTLITLPITSPIIKFEVSPSQDALGILEDNDTLTFFDKKRMQSKKLGNARDFSFSYNSKFLSFLDVGGKIGIYRLDADRLVEMDPVPNANFKNLAWYRDDAHLFLEDNGTLFFAEIDEEKPQNIYPIGLEVKKYVYDKLTNQVYFSNPSGLFKREI